MANMDHLLEFELLHKLSQIICISVHVIAVPGLARTTMAPSVMCDAAISVRGQEEHLILEGIRTERPAVAEHHWLPVTPIIVVDLRAVLGLDRTHDHSSAGKVPGQERWVDGPRCSSKKGHLKLAKQGPAERPDLLRRAWRVATKFVHGTSHQPLYVLGPWQGHNAPGVCLRVVPACH